MECGEPSPLFFIETQSGEGSPHSIRSAIPVMAIQPKLEQRRPRTCAGVTDQRWLSVAIRRAGANPWPLLSQWPLPWY